jgi:acyl-CoA synthetase (AMP-forming)/AMP-acid ligase II
MRRTAASNFAARLLARATGESCLIDAPTGQAVSSRELPHAVAAFAAGFLAAGLSPGDRVVLACDVSSVSALAYLGALYAGIVPVPIHERTWETCGEAVLRKTDARAIWSAHGVAACANGMAVRQLTGRLSAQPGARPAACRLDDVAVLMPTSGSTGVPRIVMVSHGNLIANTGAIIRSQHLGHDERAMLVLPVSYCFGASVLHTHLHQGGGVVFDPRFMFPDRVLHAIGEFGCTTFAGVPTAYNILLRRSNLRSIRLKSLRRFLQAGGALAPLQVQQMRSIVPHADFFVMYGQTEATARISCLPPERLADKLGSVGLPLDNLEIRVMDADGRETSAGQPGTIWAAGRSICRGYLEDPEASAQRFRDGWLLTGDLGYRDQDGFLWIAGRTSEFIKMRGVRVSLAAVEARVAAAPGVQECAATGVPHEEAGEALALYVVAEPGAADVLSAVRHSLAAEWICDSVSLVAALPLTPHGKLARSLLARASAGRS